MTSQVIVNDTDVSTGFFSKEELSFLDPSKLPQHVAIIMDGNRRWAKKHSCHSSSGHWEGTDVLMNAVKAAKELGIKALTVYAFSTENWTRTEKEVDLLMELFEISLRNKRSSMIENGVRLHHIGNPSRFPPSFLNVLEETKRATAHNTHIDLILALNYGGRDDIRRALYSIIEDVEKGKLSKEHICEQTIGSYLDTSPWPDPELLIRTSGEFRLSNFLLWQISYTEVYVTDTLWPDFTPHHLLKALKDYQKRSRRLGGL